MGDDPYKGWGDSGWGNKYGLGYGPPPPGLRSLFADITTPHQLSAPPSSPEPPEELVKYAKVLSALVNQVYKLDYQIDLDYVRDFLLDFLKKYDPFHEDSGPEWVSGETLLPRWKMEPSDFANKVPFWLPVHLWNTKSGWEVINVKDDKTDHYQIPSQYEMYEYQTRTPTDPLTARLEAEGKIAPSPKPRRPNVWYAIPQWWWCRLEDVEFLEATPELSNKILSSSTKYWSAIKVREWWKISERKLEEFIIDHRLKALWLHPNNGIREVHETLLRPGFLGPLVRLDHCLFRVTDLQEFEKADRARKRGPKLLSHHVRRLDKQLARDLVTRWLEDELRLKFGTSIALCDAPADWKIELHTGQAVSRLQATGDFNHITDGTLRRYLEGMPLNRDKGRYKKH